MRPKQERAILLLISIMRGRGIADDIIDDVVEMWASACHGTRFVVPKPQKNVAYRKIRWHERNRIGSY